MEQKSAIDDAFDVGAWVGRRQAFGLIAGKTAAVKATLPGVPLAPVEASTRTVEEPACAN